MTDPRVAGVAAKYRKLLRQAEADPDYWRGACEAANDLIADLTARLASMTRTLEGRICELCWGSNWSPVPPSEEHPEGRRCDHCWLTARLAAADKERAIVQEVLDETRVEFARHMDEWNAMKAERDESRAALAQAPPPPGGTQPT